MGTPTETRETLSEAILRAGRSLALAHGSSFTTQDIVREANVSLQSFYRYFPAGKDGLVLALISELIADHCAGLLELGSNVPDPVDRLELYIRSTLTPLESAQVLAGARFVTAEHWRLHSRFPREIWAATAPVTMLIRDVLVEAQRSGQLSPRDPDRDAWLMTKTILGAYHHHAFLPEEDDPDVLADDVWHYCLAAVGGR